MKKFIFIILPIFLFILITVFPVRVALATTYSSGCVTECASGSTSTLCCTCLQVSTDTDKTLGCYAADITSMLWSIVVPLLLTLVTIIFLYGVMNYVWHGGDKTKRAEGLKYIIWGLIGMFVMLSVWGLVGILSATFGLKNEPPTLPTFDVTP